jgi:predicted MPP superfamily phosphohydrolase
MKYRGNIISRIRASGVVLLDNRAVSFMGVNIGGLTTGYAVGEKQSHFLPTPPPCLDFIEEFASADGFKRLLSHHPEYYPAYIKKHTIDLTLSGHAHGGQWRFFGRGLYAPGQGIFPRYTSGMYDGRLIVSRGLSQKCIVPRINNDTEIVLVKLFPHTEE